MSAIIYEVLDMGTGITDRYGELAGSGAGIPAFVGVLDKTEPAAPAVQFAMADPSDAIVIPLRTKHTNVSVFWIYPAVKLAQVSAVPVDPKSRWTRTPCERQPRSGWLASRRRRHPQGVPSLCRAAAGWPQELSSVARSACAFPSRARSRSASDSAASMAFLVVSMAASISVA